MIKTICVDTLNGIQNNQYMEMLRKPDHDKWMDFGKDAYSFIVKLQNEGFEIVLIPGFEGTGKSYGQKFFTKDTNIWFNCDRKNPTWIGGREQYGKKSSPTKYHIIPETYSDIIRYIQAVKKSGELDENPIAFICCHIDEYKSTTGQRQRMRTLGRIATKMNIEGKMEHIYYTDISMTEGKPQYSLLTQNTGFNSGRSPEGMWDTAKIPNNFQKIVEEIDNY